MYCPGCGTSNADDAAFCKTCGADLRKYKERWATAAGGSEGTAAAGEPGSSPAAGPQETTGGGPGGTQNGYPPPQAGPPPYQPRYEPPPYRQNGGDRSGGYYPPSAYPPSAGYYQPGAYQPPYGHGVIPKIPSYMGWAIATLILCFLPTGIVAVVYASQVSNRLTLGDVLGAQDASRKAKMWCWISFGIGVAQWVLAIILFALVVVTAVHTGSSDTF